MSTKEILIKAKAMLTPETWGKKGVVFFGSKICLGQAIYRSADSHLSNGDCLAVTEADKAVEALGRIITGARSAPIGYYVDEIVWFNDLSTTTLEVVHAKLDLAIAAEPSS